MGRRFYHQQRAAQYAAEKTIIDNWIDKTAAEKSALYATQIQKTGNKKSNVGKKIGYIVPFGYDQGTDKVWLKVRLVAQRSGSPAATEESATAMITALNAATLTTIPLATETPPATAGSSVTDVARRKLKIARVRIVDVATAPLANKLNSRITGRPYTYTKKDAVSTPFGQKIGGTGNTITFEGVAALLMSTAAAPNGAGLAASYKVYVTPQGLLPISVV
jgi:hypothetical protein